MQELNGTEIRLRCLDFAIRAGATAENAVRIAEDYEKWSIDIDGYDKKTLIRDMIETGRIGKQLVRLLRFAHEIANDNFVVKRLVHSVTGEEYRFQASVKSWNNEKMLVEEVVKSVIDMLASDWQATVYLAWDYWEIEYVDGVKLVKDEIMEEQK